MFGRRTMVAAPRRQTTKDRYDLWFFELLRGEHLNIQSCRLHSCKVTKFNLFTVLQGFP